MSTDADGPTPDKRPSRDAVITANPLFGMWADRDDMDDVDAYVRDLRRPRMNLDGSRRENEKQ